MQQANLEELKSNLQEWLDRVVAGEQVLILQEGVPVARLIGESPSKALPIGVPILGRGKGKVMYMAPDFDDPIQDFDFEDLGHDAAT